MTTLAEVPDIISQTVRIAFGESSVQVRLFICLKLCRNSSEYQGRWSFNVKGSERW